MTRKHVASELAHRLGRNAEAVCRHYLNAGRRQGQYWQVGDVRNTPGRSMYVRLRDNQKGPAGKWTDAQSGEHGDLLDVIRENIKMSDFADVAAEARRFLSLPLLHPVPFFNGCMSTRTSSESGVAARRLFAMAQPIAGTLVETYLNNRGITVCRCTGSLRFHPRCYYRPNDQGPTEQWPAMIAAVTNLSGKITGAHRTWLSPDGSGKAQLEIKRKAMGSLLGHGVRIDSVDDVMAAGEGIETILSVRQIMPNMPMVAALSGAHLAAILFPDTLRRLYIVRDNDPAGNTAGDTLSEWAAAAGIEAIVLSPV
ncbi:MAG: toprim domain-containing protein, partial [Hyphomicrobium sp.]